MTDEIGRHVYMTTSVDEYRNFFSDDWAEKIQEVATQSDKLEEIIFDLTMEWRAAAYTACLPVSIIEHMEAYHDGFVNTGKINTNLLTLAQAMRTRLLVDEPELTVDPALNHRLLERLVGYCAKMAEVRVDSDVEFPFDETWSSYLKEVAFQLSLWGSQRICYVSIYNSYDNFLARMVSIAKNIDGCRTNSNEFKKNLVECFGEELRDKCWTAREVNIARLARHSLSHAGGRITKDLAKQNHGFKEVEGRIQITPEKTKALFELLKDCAYSLTLKAATLQQFG